MNHLVLDIREIINVAVTVFSFALATVFVHYIFTQLRLDRSHTMFSLTWYKAKYQLLDDAGRGAIGFTFIMLGEFLRSGTIWEILHFERPGNYSTDAPILIFALFLITVGAMCCLRVFAPEKISWWLWLATLGVTIVLVAVDMLIF